MDSPIDSGSADATSAVIAAPARPAPHSDGFAAGLAQGGVAEVTVAVFGCEQRQGRADFPAHARRVLAAPDGPDAVHLGDGVQPAGGRFDVAIGYWLSSAAFERWQAAHRWPTWCAADAAQAAAQGYWREVFVVPAVRLETLLSAADIRQGLSDCGLPVVGPVREHGYWGSMRDRIPLADRLGDAAEEAAVWTVDHGDWGVATRVRPAADLCVICSGQDWSRCAPEHARFYEEQLQPKLAVAMQALRRDAAQYGCSSLRQVRLVDEHGRPRAAGFALAMFLDLAGLERWARSDPDHLAIFGAFIAHKRATQTALRLWHEVMLLPRQGDSRACFEYLRCPPPAGLLPVPSTQEPANTQEPT